MRRVILESPFSGGDGPDKAALEILYLWYLRACMRDSLSRGESPYASHGLYTQPGVLNDDDPTEREWGIQAGFAWRESCEHTVVYDDFGISRGMKYGIDHALKRGHTVEYRKLPADVMAAVTRLDGTEGEAE